LVCLLLRIRLVQHHPSPFLYYIWLCIGIWRFLAFESVSLEFPFPGWANTVLLVAVLSTLHSQVLLLAGVFQLPQVL
jgi:hypothetical protein